MKKLILIIILLVYPLSSFADNSYFIDFKKVLNTSKHGVAAQKKLQTKFESESKKYKKIEKNIKKEENEIISQKTVISPEEYKKKIEILRKKVGNLQKNRQNSFNNIAKLRKDERLLLLKKVNPIIKKYMEENKIGIIVDKQSVIMGDTSLEITDKIIAILNK